MMKNTKDGYLRTDLAFESAEALGVVKNAVREYERSGVRFALLEVKKEDEARFDRAEGRYVTVFSGKMSDLDDDESDRFIDAFAAELLNFTERLVGKVTSETSILVCGLGNRSVTPDAFGPRVVDLLTVTRHLSPSSYFSKLSAISPGTLGQSGMEAAEQLVGVVAEIRPHAVIAIDALASRSTKRLASTVQITDSGITPGSGVGNARREISMRTLGVPVIAIGVPTVVSCATLISDALESAGLEMLCDEVRATLDEGREMYVSPRDCDVITESAASLIAAAIETAFGVRI